LLAELLPVAFLLCYSRNKGEHELGDLSQVAASSKKQGTHERCCEICLQPWKCRSFLSDTMGRKNDSCFAGRQVQTQKRGEHFFLTLLLGVEYFIGAHLAELLKRETFNLYASLNRRNIATLHADARLLNLLVSKDLVFAGTTSVTLVKFDEVSEYLADTIAGNERRKTKRTSGTKRGRDASAASADVHVSEEELAFMLTSLSGENGKPQADFVKPRCEGAWNK
jgi:hypothetical protein